MSAVSFAQVRQAGALAYWFDAEYELRHDADGVVWSRLLRASQEGPAQPAGSASSANQCRKTVGNMSKIAAVPAVVRRGSFPKGAPVRVTAVRGQ
jgi:hypothetical protein